MPALSLFRFTFRTARGESIFLHNSVLGSNGFPSLIGFLSCDAHACASTSVPVSAMHHDFPSIREDLIVQSFTTPLCRLLAIRCYYSVIGVVAAWLPARPSTLKSINLPYMQPSHLLVLFQLRILSYAADSSQNQHAMQFLSVGAHFSLQLPSGPMSP